MLERVPFVAHYSFHYLTSQRDSLIRIIIGQLSNAASESSSSVVKEGQPKKGSGGRPKGSVGKKNAQFRNVKEEQIQQVLDALIFRYHDHLWRHTRRATGHIYPCLYCSKPVSWERLIGAEERKALTGVGAKAAKELPLDKNVSLHFLAIFIDKLKNTPAHHCSNSGLARLYGRSV